MSDNDHQRPFISMVSLALTSISLLVGFLIALGVLLNLFPDANRLKVIGPVLLFAIFCNLAGFLLNFKSIQAVLPVFQVENSKWVTGLLDQWSSLEVAVYWLYFIGAVIAFLAGKALVYSYSSALGFPDTLGYVRVAEAPLLSSTFLVAERPPTYPLFLKVLGVTLANFKMDVVLTRIAKVQTILSGLSWIFLAGMVARSTRRRWFRPYFFTLILLVGLVLHISQWDALALTESLTTSLLVVGISLALCLLKCSPSQVSSQTKIVASLAFIAVVLLYAFTRDENAIFLFIIGVFSFGLALLYKKLNWNGWLGAAILFVSVSVGAQLLIIKSERWFPPFIGMVQQRILAEPSAKDSLHQLGMPQGDWLSPELIQSPRTEFFAQVQDLPAAVPFLQWMKEHGRSAYFRYVLSDPVDFFAQPLKQVNSLLSPLSYEYRGDSAVAPTWLLWLTRIMYPLSVWMVLGWLALVVVVGIWQYWGQPLPSYWWLALLLALTSPVMMLAVWYADTIEVERHAYQIGLRLRLALWFATLWLLDRNQAQHNAESV